MLAKNRKIDYTNIPETLEGLPFYGITLNEEQKIFRDAIWNKNIIFCDARAGSGKTTIAVMMADLLVKYGLYEGIVYITSPVQEKKIGFLPGTCAEKGEPYNLPFYQAAEEAGINVNTSLNDDINNLKNGTGYIDLITHIFTRGVNFKNRVVIIDEAQNMYFDELKKVLTRMHDSCKVIVIGHSGQIDLYHNPENSGFVKYLNWFKTDKRCAVCELTKNYRGWISNHADNLI
jgi:phosphate starvation-inducible protein PhoH and related proteins